MYFSPLIPTNAKGNIDIELLDKAQKLYTDSAKLSKFYNKHIITSLKSLFKISNVYYSNNLENHYIQPNYIYQAMHGHFSDNQKIKNLQFLSVASLHVQDYLIKNIYFYENPYSQDLITNIHERFYFDHNMDNFLRISNKGNSFVMQPGILREMNVISRKHEAPNFSLLNTLLHHFETSYEKSLHVDKVAKIIYALCSYHRLVWIHPFLFANERIARFHLDFLFNFFGVSGYGLWGMSRGMKKNRLNYKNALLDADEESKSINEGQLSNEGLKKYLHFMLDIANAQIEFSLKNFEKIPQRLQNYVKLSQSGFFDEEPLPKKSEMLLEKLLIYGEFPRGEVKSLIQKQDRTTTYFIKKLIELGFIYSDTPRGNLKLNFNLNLASKLFPELLPE